MALLTGISEAEILEVKQTEIHERVRQSIHQAGWLPHLFWAIVGQYNRELAEWERMVQERQRPAKSDPLRSSRSVREQLRRLQAEDRRQQPRRKVDDRDSR